MDVRVKENQETIGPNDTRRSRQGNGEAESGYVCTWTRSDSRNEALIVEDDVEK